MLSVGLIGAGAVSRPHLLGYAMEPRARVVAIADPNLEAAKRRAAEFGVPQAVADYRQLLERKDIDLIDLCVPHDLHYPIGIEALQSGKHLLSEKPIALTLAEADGLIATAQKAGRRYFVALNQRFLPAHQRAKALLEAGEIGAPFMAVVTVIGNELQRMGQPDHWKGSWQRAGGGVLIDTGTHLVDLMHYFLGQPTAVTCVARRLVVEAENKGDDVTALVLEYPHCLATLTMTYAAEAHPWQETKDIYGSAGSLHIQTGPGELLRLRKGAAVQEIMRSDPPDWWTPSVMAGVRHFVACLLEDREPIVTPADACQALATILAAYESARKGQRIEC